MIIIPQNRSLCAWLLAIAGFCSCPDTVRSQASYIVSNGEQEATVESVDVQARTILLRLDSHRLSDIHYGKEVADLPQVHAGDRLKLGYVSTLAAKLAPVDQPAPESSLITQKTDWNGHPHGVMATYRRERVKIISVNQNAHTVSFGTPDGVTRVVAVKDAEMQSFVKTLRPGVKVDVTHVDAITFTIVNSNRGR